MKVLNQVFFDVQTIWGDGRPEYQKATSTYVGDDTQYVKLIEILYINDGKEVLLWNIVNCGKNIEGKSWETFQHRIDSLGWVLGDWKEDDRVELTERGRCEANLLTSIPYLYRQIGFAG
jgi:hypothetical protein